MALSPSQFNRFMFFKLPSAWWCGVRLKQIDSRSATTSVKHRWINQNGKNISMLVLNNKANFSKKARGRIHFTCEGGDQVAGAISRAAASGQGQTVWLQAIGKDTTGDTVSTFEFEWTLKVK